MCLKGLYSSALAKFAKSNALLRLLLSRLVLMNFRLFGIPLEFVNLITALVAYACAYPAVFWRVSKPFR